MEFEIVNEGRELRITSENLAESNEIAKHYKYDVAQIASQLSDNRLTHYEKSKKGIWVLAEAQLDADWVAGYMAWMEKFLAYTGPVPFQPAPFGAVVTQGCLRHAWIAVSLEIGSEGLRGKGYISGITQPGEAAIVAANRQLAGIFADLIGYRKPSPEYVEVRNGLYARNPDWGAYKPPKPADVKHLEEAYTAVFFDWWRANVATPAQEEILAKFERWYHAICPRSHICFPIGRSYSGERCFNFIGGGSASLQEFHSLGVANGQVQSP